MSSVARIVFCFLAVTPCLCTGAVPSQEVYIKALDRSPADAFGTAVAISGDLAVVGAPKENSGARGVNGDALNESSLGSGAAYVYQRQSNGVWVQQAYLKASNTGDYDNFGGAVAISGNTIVVGAMLEDSAGSQADDSASAAGAAYVFVKSSGVWAQQAYLKAPLPRDGDLFGVAVAISGDTIVIGASRDDSAATGVNGNAADQSASRAGAAHVFTRSGAIWTEQAYLKASDTVANAEFGSSVGVSGDAVVVGAPLVGGFSGAAYLFRRNASIWSQEARVTASNAASGARFGYAVSISGNLAAVGARGEASASTGINGNQADNSAPDAGAVYVFSRGSGTWPQEAYLKASNTGGGDGFGEALSLDGDHLVVGAWGEDSNATGVNGNAANNSAEGAGAAYLFSRIAGSWAQDAYLKASNSEAGDWFGGAVAVSADLLLAGAERESGTGAGPHAVQNGNGVPNSGAMYGFTIPPVFPEIKVEAAAMPELVDDSGATLLFGPSVPGALITRSLTVRNTGGGALVVSGWTFSGADAGQFSMDASGMPAALAPGAAGTLRVQFSGTTARSYSAALSIANNDSDEASFDLNLSASVSSGSAATQYASWASAAGLNGGTAGTGVAPYEDRVANLLKYAFRMNGSGPDRRSLDAGGGTAGLPVARFIYGAQPLFRLEYLRRKGSGLTYLPRLSHDLSPNSFLPMSGTVTVTDLDSQWERVWVDQPHSLGDTGRYAIVEVTLP